VEIVEKKVVASTLFAVSSRQFFYTNGPVSLSSRASLADNYIVDIDAQARLTLAECSELDSWFADRSNLAAFQTHYTRTAIESLVVMTLTVQDRPMKCRYLLIEELKNVITY
jgi:hypothetical protein